MEHIEALGSETYLTVSLAETTHSEGLPLQARIEPDRTVTLGEMLWLSVVADKIHLFDPETRVRIA
ncbi:MAG: TOBE domain-containing protein [Leptolyngbyaceae cyanobacterium CRU_2_3]|nr:TOBE domain-containing protein [Leptolyngbyaceae cyanobacterium CRU_2_3]